MTTPARKTAKKSAPARKTASKAAKSAGSASKTAAESAPASKAAQSGPTMPAESLICDRGPIEVATRFDLGLAGVTNTALGRAAIALAARADACSESMLPNLTRELRITLKAAGEQTPGTQPAQDDEFDDRPESEDQLAKLRASRGAGA